MRLIEHDARGLLKSLGCQVVEGTFLPFFVDRWPRDVVWNGVCYLKAQVLAGRRERAGLVCRCATVVDADRFFSDMHHVFSEETCAGFLCVPDVPHTKEWFLSVDLDFVTGGTRFHLSGEGGVDVAQTQTWMIQNEESIQRIPLPFQPWAHALTRGLRSLDAFSIEVNPCVQGEDDSYVALDVKIELDEAAAFRHPEWHALHALSRWGEQRGPRERAYIDLLKSVQGSLPLGRYVELEGDIGMILAGGGASLYAMDALRRVGGKPANYLEISGNPDPAFLRKAAEIVVSRPGLKALWVAGSFANFTDIQQTTRAILQALESSQKRFPVCIRRDGPQTDEARQEALQWADRLGIPLVFERADQSLLESAEQVQKMIK